ncbi:MAG: RnfABCDGE type electron transport complex subunit D [Spirochaetes bacterium]|nr:RnfABCDGE type electron transport complex subunit D [Spirochaetota bacterium]
MFQKQLMMRKVIYSLIPIYIFALWLYGIRLLFLSALVFPAAIFIEYIMEKRNKKPVSEAVLVTAMLFVLSLPPKTPWWIALVGISFGVLFAKEVFGGFGRNPFNPAICGRLFIYLTFPNEMTLNWQNFGNFGSNFDAVTSATPLGLLQQGESINLLNHLLGFRIGSMGEGLVLLIIAAGIYLIWTKTASYEIIVSTIGSAFLLHLIFQYTGVPNALPAIPAMLSGSLLFVAVFMATDPISAPKKNQSKWIYGILIGCSIVIIRTFSLFPEGTSFAVLLGNTFALLFDEIFTKKVKK